MALIFTSDAIDRYNACFQFLYPLKQATWQLQQCWSLLMEYKSIDEELSIEIWMLRREMNFLLDHVLFYFQITVIESAFETLVNAIHSSPDIEAVQRAHEAYLATLTKLCYLRVETIRDALTRILTCCMEFTKWIQLPAAKRQWIKYQTFAKEFEIASTCLLMVLRNTNARELTLHLNFNQYYNKLTLIINYNTKVSPDAALRSYRYCSLIICCFQSVQTEPLSNDIRRSKKRKVFTF